MSRPRVPFDQDDDRLLMKYIATYNPEKKNRLGNTLYKRLVENADGKWPWSKRHSWQSWRERYKDNEDRFNFAIRQYQKKKGITMPADHTSKSIGTGKKEELSFIRSVPSSGQHQPSGSNPTETVKQERTKDEEADAILPSPGMVVHKRIARKTARKTVVLPNRREEEEPDANESDEVGSEDESAIRRKRKDNGLSTPGHSKRQRTEDGEVAPGQTKSLLPGAPQTVKLTLAGRALELLSSFGENGRAFDQNKALDLFFEALNLRPEEKQEVMELAKARLPGLSQLPSANEERQQQIYPRLEEDDYNQTEEANIDNAMPGSWDKTDERAANNPVQAQRTESAVESDARPLIGSDSARIHRDAERRIPSVSISPSAQSRHRVSNKPLGEDFFKTPSPSPVKTGPMKPTHPEHPSSAKEALTSSDASRAQLPRREPPQFVNGPFRNTITVPRKQSLSPGKTPDVDTGSDTSDTEIIPDNDAPPVRVMINAQAPTESWPPARNKKHRETDAIPAPARGAVERPASLSAKKNPRDVAARKTTASTTKVAPQASEEAPRIGVTTTKSILTSPDRILQSHSFRGPSEFREPHSGTSRGHLKEPKAPALERRGQTILTEYEGKGPIRTTAAAKASTSLRNAVPMRTTAKVALEPGVVSKANSANIPERSRDAQARPQHSVEGGPLLPLRGSVVRSVPIDAVPRTENILAWRSETQVSDDRDEDVPLTSVNDPFLTIEHVKALRRLAKGKAKEQVLGNEESRTADAKARAARRKTFGGLPTKRPPEIDLRKRALRSSIASNLPPARQSFSFSPLNTETNDKEEKGEDDESQVSISKRTHRASVAATIDLSREFPSPDLIPSSDTGFIISAGIQVLLQRIAQNHSVSEELVRGIYEELMDLRVTDRIVAKMRRTAEQVVEVELERAKENKRRSSNATTPESEALPSPNYQLADGLQVHAGPEKHDIGISPPRDSHAQPVLGRRYSESTIKPAGTAANPQSTPTIRHRTSSASILSPEKHGPEVSVVSASRARTLSESRRRHSELFITPADDDPTYVRLRSQYVPPSTSRAAREIRHAVGRSSGLVNSPLNGFDESMDVDVDNEEEDEKEEEEVSLALTPARRFDNDDSNENWEEKENDVQSAPNTALPSLQKPVEQSDAAVRESSVLSVPPWTMEEDDILLGDDEEAIKAIVANKGKLAVRLRMAELAQ